MTRIITPLICVILACNLALGADSEKTYTASKVIVYKTVQRKGKTYNLKLYIFNPPNHKDSDQTPCIILFHSGGWSSGSPSRYFSSCHDWANRGMVAISAEYSIRQVHQGTPFDSVRDGKSAIRWLRSHAKDLGINPDMIAAGGGSAGAQVAAAAAHLTAFDEKGEDSTISSKPNALLLVSPVFDNGPGRGYGYNKVKSRWKEFSTLENVAAGAPPVIVFVGTNEAKYLRVESAKAYRDKIKAVGSRCDLFIYEGGTHGCPQFRQEIKKEKIRFLTSLGYLQTS